MRKLDQLSIWLTSFRLKTLPLAISAILVGSALAYWQQQFHFGIMFFSLLTATLLQILSNLANDYGDALSGADKHGRIGPERGIQLGLITLQQLKLALKINTVLVIISGLILLWLSYHSWLSFFGFILLGLLAIIAAITYTVGSKPYGYQGLGDLSVLVFFGLVSIMGSYYLQTESLKLFLVFPAIGCGLLSVAVLNINNLRDIDSDRLNHKRTLVVMIGERAGRHYHVILLILSLILLSYFSWCYLASVWSWLFLLVTPLYLQHLYRVLTYQTPKQVPPLLYQMIRIALLTDLLYCIGIILS
ncbi:1,4-dihydroxy-2-naphthoate polyprenyltransferase [Zophobihabitans entericus]|uniref:1,4-dihydroxy-2-naphthoate octaprenyltransferase n=1 Tax=Zophobihabitans entericus TaxID=1635327 RepID=A0A6G9IAG6_9GAMM|nr:1,4-dihydroxy-2-naphthoate polyprenyltransferase [Zophobihabitans entericus]QIQ20819.1 1,4-dihydroxy-2-naphthoate polyprenyltransferase [Zophobihabitans entericus]